MEVRGLVENITENGEWLEIKIGGKKVSTKKWDTAEGMNEGMFVVADVTSKTNSKDGKTYTNYYLNSYQEGDATAPAPRSRASAPGGTNGATKPADTDWEAKDRRIAMEAAYGSAARFMMAAATAGNKESVNGKNLTILARVIYKDVIAAGNGVEFAAPKPAPVEAPPIEEGAPF